MPEAVDPRHLLLVGAGPGVGAGVVRRFGREGFRSTLISRGGTLERLAAEFRSGGLEVEAVVADIADLGGYRATLERIFGAPGPPGLPCTTLRCRILARSSTPRRSGFGPRMTSLSSARSSRHRTRPAECRRRHPAVHERRLRRPSGARPGEPLNREGRPARGGEPDRRRCPEGRHPYRNHHDRRPGRAWDGVRSGQHRGTLLDCAHRPEGRLADRVSIHGCVTGPRDAWP
jgi:hypothetical protein